MTLLYISALWERQCEESQITLASITLHYIDICIHNNVMNRHNNLFYLRARENIHNTVIASHKNLIRSNKISQFKSQSYDIVISILTQVTYEQK